MTEPAAQAREYARAGTPTSFSNQRSAAAEGILAGLIFTYDLGVRGHVLLKLLAVPFLRQRLSGAQ
jgi:hypothetical protein